MRLLLALDAGTSGVRTVAFDESLLPVDEAYRDLSAAFPEPGRVEQDPLEIAALAVDTLREVAQRAVVAGHEVVALGITNQRETTVSFDRSSGHVAHAALVWQDRRTADACRSLIDQGHEAFVRASTGLVIDPYFSATKMRWLLDHSDVASMASPALCTVDTWLAWTISGGTQGGVYVSEASNASRTMLMDLATFDWSPTLLELFGVERSFLAAIGPSVGHLGEVAAEVVPELAGVPITAMLGDQQSALFGQACFSPGLIKATYGTGAFVLVNAGTTRPDVVDGLLTTVAWDLGDGARSFALEGSAFVAGAAVTWLTELGLLHEPHELEALARSVDDAGGVAFVPALSGLGSPFWRPDARGAMLGLGAGTTRGALARALVDALAFQVRSMTDAFRDGGVEVGELRADGGAAAMDLLLSLQATNSRLAVARSATLEATARGAASAAGLGVGLFHSLEEIASTWRAEQRFTPRDPTLVDASYAAWQRAVTRA